MKLVIMILSAALLVSCNQQDAQPKKLERQSIVRNLPTEDRDYLLEPLEAALDDLRKVIDDDEGLFSSSTAIDQNGFKGDLKYKLDGKDSVFADEHWQSDVMKHRRLKYWDKNGHLFYTEIHLTYFDEGGEAFDQRAYRMYLEEGLVPISTYGKASFHRQPLPDSWQTICPTDEELQLILGNSELSTSP